MCALAVLIFSMFCHVIHGLFDDAAANQAIYRRMSKRLVNNNLKVKWQGTDMT
jgi:hypothetical protein